MKTFWSALLILATLLTAQEPVSKDTAAFVPKPYISTADYQTIVDSMAPGSKFGLSIRSLHTGKQIAAVNADSFFTPASTMKTVTTAAALDYLPLNFQPKTSVHMEGSTVGKKFSGVIRLRSEGDPNISARFYTDPFYVLNGFADSIRQKNIDTLQIRIELDTSYFSGPRKPDHWRSNYFDSWYGAEITPLEFNDNCALIRMTPGKKIGDTASITVDPDVGFVKVENSLTTVKGAKRKWKYALDKDAPIVRISGTIGVNVTDAAIVVPVRDPNHYFQAAFIQALKNRGFTVMEDSSAQSGIDIHTFHFEGTPLLSYLDEINQRSQNLHAETLFRNFAAAKFGVGNLENGRQGVHEFIQKMELSPNDFDLFDGCGLSPKNKLKPSSETALLAKMARHPRGKYYVQSFASPGIGSGYKRMNGLEYAWRIRFKTGFINEAHGLVGYMPTIDGDTLVIASYLNKTGKTPDNTCRGALDSIWMSLYRAVNNGYASLLSMRNLYIQGESVSGTQERIRFFSEKFMDRPYLLGPTGEGYLDTIEPKPMIYTDSLDCVTYLEHVLALAKSPDEDSLFSTLQRIRYLNGEIAYKFRKHYFVLDWIGEGTFAKQLPLPNDTLVVRTIPKKKFFRSKKISYDQPDPQIYLKYLPLEKAIEFASSTWQGENSIRGIGFVSRLNVIDIFHTGFLILEKGKKPVLRDASSKFGKVLDHELQGYLESWVGTGKLPGIILFEFL
ncbi:MAG: D-alanyl-D-alanine carboxypeptidase/D-alanyl-D-alanine-endopeptidase [Fibrobacter sp.]|nr:D-alanyl-D-alanine carboxypeptidase/D-alanyl-D-alanine-endopeptidase [Fibrobacter sp.]